MFKSGEKNNVKNYRGISILPTIALILEKHVCSVLLSFLQSRDVFSPNQFGFVSGRGTQKAVEEVSDFLNEAIDQNEFACALFLDATKAFDCVHHGILCDKLYNYGIRGPFLSLLTNYLADRSQTVVIGKVRSARSPLCSGVPQGSILAPVLFNLYVNDLSDSILYCRVVQYADDTLLISRHIEYATAVKNLQHDCEQLMEWFENNVIGINKTKTQLVCFHNPLKPTSQEIQSSYTSRLVIIAVVLRFIMSRLLSTWEYFSILTCYGTAS